MESELFEINKKSKTTDMSGNRDEAGHIAAEGRNGRRVKETMSKPASKSWHSLTKEEVNLNVTIKGEQMGNLNVNAGVNSGNQDHYSDGEDNAETDTLRTPPAANRPRTSHGLSSNNNLDVSKQGYLQKAKVDINIIYNANLEKLEEMSKDSDGITVIQNIINNGKRLSQYLREARKSNLEWLKIYDFYIKVNAENAELSDLTKVRFMAILHRFISSKYTSALAVNQQNEFPFTISPLAMKIDFEDKNCPLRSHKFLIGTGLQFLHESFTDHKIYLVCLYLMDYLSTMSKKSEFYEACAGMTLMQYMESDIAAKGSMIKNAKRNMGEFSFKKVMKQPNAWSQMLTLAKMIKLKASPSRLKLEAGLRMLRGH